MALRTSSCKNSIGEEEAVTDIVGEVVGDFERLCGEGEKEGEEDDETYVEDEVLGEIEVVCEEEVDILGEAVYPTQPEQSVYP